MIYRITNDAAESNSIIFREDDQIVSVQILGLNGATAGFVELSFGSVANTQGNDAPGSIFNTKLAGVAAINHAVNFGDAPIKVQGGEKLYLHTSQTMDMNAIIVTKQGSGNKLTSPARR